ncbi:MAG: protein phosphatase 2C domain-containing protein [Candidatus Krumholzibacteria bacterium]|nr:protein phosphatase 2C domain-containing protein [Candidatus Krumholzibacteria bacterium]
MTSAENTSIKFIFGASSDRGSVRERNEDYYGIFVPETDALAADLGVLAVVADGMGGHLEGAAASKKSVEVLGSVYYEGTGAAVREEGHGGVLHESRGKPAPSTVNRLRWAFLEANRQVFETVGEGHNGMAGTTCTAVVFLPEVIHIAHAGDSRAYLLRKGGIEQITEDHSVVGEMVRKGMLSREEALKHPHRNVITKAVGLRGKLEVDISESIPIEKGDRILICSDGLFSMLDEDEIARVAADGTPEKVCRKLIKRAKEEGGSDNVTVIIAEKIA